MIRKNLCARADYDYVTEPNQTKNLGMRKYYRVFLTTKIFIKEIIFKGTQFRWTFCHILACCLIILALSCNIAIFEPEVGALR